MADIIVNHNMAGLTAAEARATLKSQSWRRNDVDFFDSMGNRIAVPAKSDTVGVITEVAQKQGAAGGFKVANNTADYLEQWEKNFATGPLANSGYAVDARDTSSRWGAPKEWDSFAISVNQAVSDADLATLRKIVTEELQSPAVLGMKDANGDTIPFKGMNGKRAIFISETHDNTGNRHLHVLVNRFAFDMQGKEVSVAVDLSRSGVVQTVMDNIEARIRAEGMQHSFASLNAKSKAITQNTQALVAQAATQQQLSQAGGQAPGRVGQVGVTVPVSPGQTMVVAAPLTPDALGMQEQSTAIKADLERINRDIERLQREATAKAESAAKLDQAVQALADNEVLRSTLEDTQAKLVEVTAKGESLEEANTDLTQKLDAAQEARQIQHEALVGIGTNLSEQASTLGLDSEQSEDLARGNVEAIGTIVDTLGKQVGAWNEALDQLPEDVAEALREDPVQALNDLVDELLNKRQMTTDLTTERDSLQGELQLATALNGELQGKLDAKAADLEDIKAKMAQREAEFERQMSEMTEKVRASESAVLRAEGAVSAKQEQLVEEQAKVEKLTRTKDALLSVMTSDNASQAWEQSKDYFKDDAFANRAMGAFLRTGSELEQAQQRIASMQAELVDLGQVRENLAAAQATVEETLGLVNDAGVADLRTLVQEHKKLATDNDTLQQQIRDLAQAAEQEAVFAKAAESQIESLKTALAEAQAQAPQASDLDPKMQAALALLVANPELASLVDEAANNDALRKTLMEIVGAETGGLQPAQGPTGTGTDYTRGLTDDNSQDGPKKDDPDQSNNR